MIDIIFTNFNIFWPLTFATLMLFCVFIIIKRKIRHQNIIKLFKSLNTYNIMIVFFTVKKIYFPAFLQSCFPLYTLKNTLNYKLDLLEKKRDQWRN